MRETEWRKRWLEKPGNRERVRVAAREWQRRYDREHREEVREVARMGYRLRREQAGLPARQRRRTVVDGTEPRLPIGPFRRWLEAYRRARDLSVAELGVELGLGERMARRYLSGDQGSVALDNVSRALTEARTVVTVDGRLVVTLDDVYSM